MKASFASGVASARKSSTPASAAMGVRLLRLPGLLGGGLAEAAPPVHRALRARVPHAPPLQVGGVVLEVARVPLLVDLGGHHLARVADEVDVGLLPALQAGEDLVDDAVLEEQCERFDHSGGRAGAGGERLMKP